jgi:hypothetical protein
MTPAAAAASDAAPCVDGMEALAAAAQGAAALR